MTCPSDPTHGLPSKDWAVDPQVTYGNGKEKTSGSVLTASGNGDAKRSQLSRHCPNMCSDSCGISWELTQAEWVCIRAGKISKNQVYRMRCCVAYMFKWLWVNVVQERNNNIATIVMVDVTHMENICWILVNGVLVFERVDTLPCSQQPAWSFSLSSTRHALRHAPTLALVCGQAPASLQLSCTAWQHSRPTPPALESYHTQSLILYKAQHIGKNLTMFEVFIFHGPFWGSQWCRRHWDYPSCHNTSQHGAIWTHFIYLWSFYLLREKMFFRQRTNQF